MPDLIRADILLAELGLAPSRTLAQQYIAAGRVSVIEAGRRMPVSKASQKLLADAEIEVEPDDADAYVSRGGLKLAGALAHTGLQVRGWRCLDAGISTGGFTDCLLQAGAAHVVGVDVGHGQLHPQLMDDERVTLFEGVNARSLDAAELLEANDGEGYDLIVADLSFISLTLVLPALVPLAKPGARLLCLIKPQFEVGRDNVGKGGLVRDTALYAEVKTRLCECAGSLGLRVDDWFDSPITGGDGNHEFFMLATQP
ncbi:TlyA family RNA methyltransferase [Chitinimonas sp. BJYL2]|uniref:TlyA family RNA methyltransferase n=1 Tax=Chitinimonas sp. BJYL2 TaxID=2976696 RepID=UPI0022B35CA2|nr:TlyA family RNA methyltransferase [Chitinimonas sp. BJYL2]